MADASGHGADLGVGGSAMTANRVLVPYIQEEAIGTAEAARLCGLSERGMRERATLYPIARKIGGWLTFSRVAVQLHLEGDAAALEAYAYGERVRSHERKDTHVHISTIYQ